MSFLSNVRAVAYKETAIVRHDKALVGMVIAQPIMMLLLFGLALSNEPANVPWAVLDRDESPLSRRFVQDVHATGYFLPWQSVPSYDEGYRRLLLNLTGTRIINSIGISILIEIIEKMLEVQGKLAFCALTPTIEKTFHIMGLAQYASIHPDESAAVAQIVS